MAYTPVTLSVPKGGTGQVTLTSHGVLVGEGTSAIGQTAAGTAGQVLQSGGALADPVYSTATFPSTGGSVGTILRSDGTNWLNTAATYPNAIGANQLLYASSNNAINPLVTANRGLLVTSSAGVPSILASPATTGQILQSNAAAAPSFSTASYPSTTTINQILYSSAANTITGLASANSGVLLTSASGVPSITIAGTSFTPTVVGAGTAGTTSYSTQVGRYIQIGPMVIYSFTIVGTYGGTAAGNANISIPIASVGTTSLNQYGSGIAISNAVNNAGAYTVNPSVSVMTYIIYSTVTSVQVTAAANFNFQGTISYLVA